MQPIEYTLSLQRILLIVLAISFLGICSLVAFFDPFSQFFAFWLFLINFVLVLGIIQIFAFFWWYFYIKKVILTVPQVNILVYQSFTLSILLTYLSVLNYTQSLNNFSLALVVFVASLYLFFLRF